MNEPRNSSDLMAFKSAKTVYGNHVEAGRKFNFQSGTQYVAQKRILAQLTSTKYGLTK
jgi:hypothetical protein